MRRFNALMLSTVLCAGFFAASSSLVADAKHGRNHNGNNGLHRGWYKNGKAWGARDWRGDNNDWRWQSNSNWHWRDNDNWRWQNRRNNTRNWNYWNNNRWNDNNRWSGSRDWNRYWF